MATKTYQYKGEIIRRDAFRFRVSSMTTVEENGLRHVPAFTTLKAAKTFIDRNREGWTDR